MCWQSTILNKQIAAECVPVVKVCELYYPFAVLYSGGAVFIKAPIILLYILFHLQKK